MTTRTARRMAPAPINENDGDDRYAELLDRYNLLRTNAAEVVQEYKSLREDKAPFRSTAGVFLVLLAFVIAARLGIYEFVEDGGGAAGMIGILSDVLLCGGAIMLLFAWVCAEWNEIAWIAVVKFAFVFFALLLGASIVDDGALLHGHFSARATHPIMAGLVAIGALLLAASPLAVAAVRGIMDFLNDKMGGGGR